MIPFIFIGSLMLVFTVIPAIVIACGVNKEYEHFDKNGLLTNAVVTENTRRRRKNAIHYTTKVKYIGSDGVEHESELWHSDGIAVGTYVNIRYVPGEYDTVLLVEQGGS
jgi:hypothetical protein